MNKRRRAQWEERRAQLAGEVGITEDDVEEIMDVLPYSCVPDLDDVRRVLDVVDEIRDRGGS